jgi:hypothetical protein
MTMMMGSGMVFWMLAMMGGFIYLLFMLGIANIIMRENSFSKRKQKNESHFEEEYFFYDYDEKLKHGTEFILSDDGELLEIADNE